MTNPRTRDRSREFDIVLWGATGFTGKLVANYLARNYLDRDAGVRLALAGRNEGKVRAVAQEIGKPDIPVIVADSFDRPALDAMAARTEVVLTTVGPYAKYGADLVAACVQAGTDYCDLTGESPFVRDMIDAHHEEAKRTGARIVNCCGYDSIPSELGALMVQEAFKQRHGRYAGQVKMAAGETRGGLSGGTLASLLYIAEAIKENPKLRKVLGNPYALNPEGVRGPDGSDQAGVRFDKDFNMWTGPFLMAAINTRIVRRGHALRGLPWGEGFRYSEVMTTGKGFQGWSRAATFAAGIPAFVASVMFPLTRPMVLKRLPEPGEGPSEETMANGYFKSRFIALENGSSVRGLVADQRDPGYGSTAVMISEAALCLALQGHELESEGGLLTPASAMGMPLIARLRAAGLRFEVEGAAQ